MLGFKSKEKEIENEQEVEKEQAQVQVEQVESQAETQEAPTMESQTDIEETVPVQEESEMAEVQDKFDLAHLLGKTESGLKTEFYAYQIKEVMSSVAKSFLPEKFDAEQIEKAYAECVKFGAKEIAVTPYMYQACKYVESKFVKGQVKFGAFIDFPYGESSHKARIADVKYAIANGVDLITATFPIKAFSLGSVGVEKARLNKLCKVAKRSLGVSVNVDLDDEDMKKMLKIIDGTRVAHVTLRAENASMSTITKALSMLAKQKGNKKIFVYSTINNIEDLSTLLELKVDKIYTPYLEEIGYALCAKFGINL